MSAYGERVEMALHPGEFILSVRAAAKATGLLRHRLSVLDATAEATWEPHDWTEFD